SASPIAIDTREYLIIPADTAHLRVRIENTGAKPLDSCLVRFQVNGGAWSNYETVIFKDKNGNITPKFKGQKMWYDFEQGWLNGGAGSYNVCVETFKPDSKLDDIPTDDQLCITIDVLDEIAITTGNGYCNDFESSTTASWVALHANDKKLAHDWEFGTPNQTQINAAASGSNAWVTFADSNYSSMSQSAVHTPFFYLNPNNTYSLSFKHNMLTEQYHDGGSVDWSYDGGVTWYTLGNVLQNGLWYNTVHVTSLDIIRPGWSGNTNGWITSNIKFTVENAGKLVFRFRFGSDFTQQNEGWAIDDFCLDQSPAGTPADIVGIGMDEDQIPGFFLGHITPNPVGQIAQLQFNGDRPLKLKLRVIDLLGKEIMHQAVQGDVGYNSFDIDVSAWANGMYTVIAEVEGGTLMRKFIVQH
ncbi:MAG: T9SS type A sorting domain-containing protein, partial [Schleiferiaceae bacterium]|nr:T9SS type A sorting domain-containing protein [Schleiferiaceae bacterium]